MNEVIPSELLESVQQKKRNYVYLAGQINSNPRTYEWREEFTELVKNESQIVVVNPCANRFNQGMRTVKGDGIIFAKEAVKRSQKILRSKDYQMIKMSSLMVVHLCYSTPEKPMVGTLQELTWARDIFNIPTIGVTEGEESIYTTHPWILECLSAKVETVEEAADMIKTFFLEY
jgi:hypothetical protein